MDDQVKETIKSIIIKAESILLTAKLGFSDFVGPPGPRTIAGLHNVFVFGRSVTLVLQNLSGKAPGFAEWYLPYRESMAADPVLKYFVEVRNEILKQGKLETGRSIRNFHLNDAYNMGDPPPNYKSIFIGDEYGGSGWIVELPDGSEVKYYAKPPAGVIQSDLIFEAIPARFNEAIGTRSIRSMAEEYLTLLTKIVADCRNHYLPEVKENKPPHRTLPSYLRVIK